MKYIKKVKNIDDIKSIKMCVLDNSKPLIIKCEEDDSMFVAGSSQLRKAKFNAIESDKLCVSTLAPFSVFKVDGGENLIPSPIITEKTLLIGPSYNSIKDVDGLYCDNNSDPEMKWPIESVIIKSSTKLKETDCLWASYGTNEQLMMIGTLADLSDIVDFRLNKIDVTHFYIREDILFKIFYISNCADNPDFYDIQIIYKGEQYNYEEKILNVPEYQFSNLYYDPNIPDNLFIGNLYSKMCEITLLDNDVITDDDYFLIFDGYYKDQLFLNDINGLTEIGICIKEGNKLFIPLYDFILENGAAFFIVNLSTNISRPITIKYYELSNTDKFLNNPYYFDAVGEHTIEFEYINKFYYPYNTNNTTIFNTSTMIEFDYNFLDFGGKPQYDSERIDSISISNNTPEATVEDIIAAPGEYLHAYPFNSKLKIKDNKYKDHLIVVNDFIIDRTDMSLIRYVGDSSIATIPNFIKIIHNGTFYASENLKRINLPPSVIKIWAQTDRYPRPIYNCNNFYQLNINSLESYLNINSDEYSMASEYPSSTLFMQRYYESDNVTPSELYLNDELITDLVIPGSTSIIPRKAFAYIDSIMSVTIPDSVTFIGAKAFNCKNLTEITCFAQIAPELGDFVFLKTSGILRVPMGSDYSSWLTQLGDGWTIEYI